MKSRRQLIAPWLDSVTIEMLQWSNIIILSRIEKLYNNVYYPDAWINTLIQSIYISGGKYNTNSYRAVTEKLPSLIL